MSEQKTVQEIAFELLANACNLKEETLINTFDYENQFKTWFKKRDGNKPKLIEEPCVALKIFQKSLLQFLYRLKVRTDYCSNWKFWKYEEEELAYKEVLRHNLSFKMHGQIPKRSLATTGSVHENSNYPFMIKMDLKEAYHSVSGEKLFEILYGIFFDEIKAYYEAFKELPNSFASRRKKQIAKFRRDIHLIREQIFSETRDLYDEEDVLDEEHFRNTGEFLYYSHRIIKNTECWQSETRYALSKIGYDELINYLNLDELLKSDGKNYFYRRPSSKNLYPPVPLFSSLKFPKLRKMIRDLVSKGESLEGSQVDDVIKCFTEYIVRLSTFNNRLPKGAPSSGFLLNLVINETGILKEITKSNETCSVWVDDIIITTLKKPDSNRIEEIIRTIEGSNIFKHNPKKIRVYDLRNKSGTVLGMKLNHRVQTEKEKEWFEEREAHLIPRGYRRARRLNREWTVNKLILSKKKQKQYRAFLYMVMTKPHTTEEKDKAMGYLGHILSVYGWGYRWTLPSSLSKIVLEFRKKFLLGKVKDKNKYRYKKSRLK
jgi:hypothetical protein